MGSDQTKRRPVGEGLLHDAAGDPGGVSYLIGVRCPICELVQFPRFWICPRCLDRERPPENFPLSGRAAVRQFCVAERGPKEFNPPYVLGQLRLLEGPLVYSLIRGVDPARPDLEVGQAMSLEVDVVQVAEDGTEIVGWVARPATGKDS